GRVAWPTRGMMKNIIPASAKVPAAATSETRKRGLRGPMPPAATSGLAPAESEASETRWWRMSIQVPRMRKAMKTKRKHTLKVTAEAATSMKNERKPASRRSLRERGRGGGPHARGRGEIGEEAEGQERAHQPSSMWSSRSERQPRA